MLLRPGGRLAALPHCIADLGPVSHPQLPSYTAQAGIFAYLDNFFFIKYEPELIELTGSSQPPLHQRSPLSDFS